MPSNTPRGDEIRLRHMLDASREAMAFARGRTREDLDADRLLVLGLLKSVEIVGEAAGRVSVTTQRRLHGIPWNDIVGMRNRLVHAYFDVDLDLIWNTVRDDLPPLVTALEKAIGSEG